jgi:hypothetical protein
MSTMKNFRFTERFGFDMGAQVQNLFNRHNFDVPSLDVNASNFGVISTMQALGNAGPRAILLTGKVTF